MGRPRTTFVFDRLTLLQALKFPDFYKVPGIESWAVEGAGVYERALDGSLRGTGCGSCGEGKGELNELLWKLGAVAAASEATRAGLVAFITAKRRYRPVPILLYYRDDTGRVQTLTM